MGGKSASVGESNHCSCCGEKCQDAGSGFISVCVNKGNASGQETGTYFFCAKCLKMIRAIIKVVLRPSAEEQRKKGQQADPANGSRLDA